jgi:hypothetical protein
VVAKKEDPATHEKFIAVLKLKASSAAAEQGTGTVAALLGAGRLVDVFWQRLSTSLQVSRPRPSPVQFTALSV